MPNISLKAVFRPAFVVPRGSDNSDAKPAAQGASVNEIVTHVSGSIQRSSSITDIMDKFPISG